MAKLVTSRNVNHNLNKSVEVLCFDWNADGTIVFSGGCDKQAKLWLLASNQPVTVAMHEAPIKQLTWLSEMNFLVTGSWDKTLK
ncbi:hypothetical protein QQ045_025937 [Rhodiola kirilowii]